MAACQKYDSALLNGDVAVNTKNKKSAGEIFKSICKILSPSLMLSAIILIFILSFFIGFRVNEYSFSNIMQDLGSVTEMGIEDRNIFYYFGEVYKDINSEIYQLKDANIDPTIISKVEQSYLFPTITLTVILGLHFVCLLCVLILASVKFGKGIAKGEEVNLSTHAGLAFGSFIIASFSIVLLSSIFMLFDFTSETEELYMYLSVTPNNAIILGTIFSGVIIFLGIIISLILKGKHSIRASSITSNIINALIIALVFVTIGILISDSASIYYTTTSFDIIGELEITFGSMEWLFFFNSLVIQQGKFYNYSMQTVNYALINTMLCFGSVIMLGLILKSNVTNLIHKKAKGIMTVVYSAVLVGLCICYLCLSDTIINNIYNYTLQFGVLRDFLLISGTLIESNGPVVCVILSGIIFVLSIISLFFTFVKNKPEKSVLDKELLNNETDDALLYSESQEAALNNETDEAPLNSAKAE